MMICKCGHSFMEHKSGCECLQEEYYGEPCGCKQYIEQILEVRQQPQICPHCIEGQCEQCANDGICECACRAGEGRLQMVTKFRKKPVVIEAILWTGINFDEVMQFFGDLSKLPSDGVHIEPGIGHTPALGQLHIPTLEGVHTASPGDWIIKGVKGEFYPCKPDIFDIIYEPETAPVSEGPEHAGGKG